MIIYSTKRNELKKYIKARFFFNVNSKLISMLVLLPFTIYFFCIGIIVDKEALLFAFSLLIILICLAFICFVSYKAIKKITIKSFDKFAKNDVIEYKLLKNKDIFELICLNNDEKFTLILRK